MLRSSIQVSFTPHEEISYDFLAKRYYKRKNPKEAKPFKVGVGYYIAIVLAVSFGHQIDRVFDPLQFDTSLLVVISIAFGLMAGRLVFLVYSGYVEKKGVLGRLPCTKDDVVEGYHLVSDGLRRFKVQVYAILSLILILILFTSLTLLWHMGLMMALVLFGVSLTLVFSVSLIHPLAFYKYLIERADVLKGHKLDSWLDEFIYWIHLRRVSGGRKT
jgi:hypothetical protein